MLHAAAREAEGRAATPSMVVIDTHLARGASNGGATFYDRGGPFGRTKGAQRVVAVEVTGLPVAGLVLPASMYENETTRVVLDHLARQGVTDRLELVLVDPGVSARAANKLSPGTAWRCAGSGGMTSSRCSVHPAGLARRGGPRPARPQPQTRQVLREHHRLRDRLAPARLHRHDPAAPEPGRGTAGEAASSRVAARDPFRGALGTHGRAAPRQRQCARTSR